ncbi:pilus assembly protein [Rhodobacterales bacterium]|nr:pilus assembly protein [Rhodobacterales bacterium]
MRWTKRILRPFTSSKGRRFLEDEQGVTAIEFAIVAIPFMVLCFGIIEIGLALLVNRMVDNAVVGAARMIRTGQVAEGEITKDQFKRQVCDLMPSFMCSLNRITLDVQTYDTFAAAGSMESLYDDDGKLKSDEETSFDPGSASSIVVVNVIYDWPMMTSLLGLDAADQGNLRHLSSTVVFRNEPWE